MSTRLIKMALLSLGIVLLVGCSNNSKPVTTDNNISVNTTSETNETTTITNNSNPVDPSVNKEVANYLDSISSELPKKKDPDYLTKSGEVISKYLIHNDADGIIAAVSETIKSGNLSQSQINKMESVIDCYKKDIPLTQSKIDTLNATKPEIFDALFSTEGYLVSPIEDQPGYFVMMDINYEDSTPGNIIIAAVRPTATTVEYEGVYAMNLITQRDTMTLTKEDGSQIEVPVCVEATEAEMIQYDDFMKSYPEIETLRQTMSDVQKYCSDIIDEVYFSNISK